MGETKGSDWPVFVVAPLAGAPTYGFGPSSVKVEGGPGPSISAKTTSASSRRRLSRAATDTNIDVRCHLMLGSQNNVPKQTGLSRVL